MASNDSPVINLRNRTVKKHPPKKNISVNINNFGSGSVSDIQINIETGRENDGMVLDDDDSGSSSEIDEDDDVVFI